MKPGLMPGEAGISNHDSQVPANGRRRPGSAFLDGHKLKQLFYFYHIVTLAHARGKNQRDYITANCHFQSKYQDIGVPVPGNHNI